MNGQKRDTNEHETSSVLTPIRTALGTNESDGHGSSGLRFGIWALLVGAVPLIVVCAGLLSVAFVGGCPLVTHCPWFSGWR